MKEENFCKQFLKKFCVWDN